MRPALFLFSLLALLGSLVLLVADSMGPCERIEDARADYSYALICMGEVAAGGVVSFSNESYSRWFDVEEDPGSINDDASGSNGNDDSMKDGDEEPKPGGLEPETHIRFAVARTEMDDARCGPGTGTGVLELAIAHAAVSWAGHSFLFHCEVYPQADSVPCIPGPEPSPLSNEDGPEAPQEPQEPQDPPFPCDLVLTATEPPSHDEV